jgi:hypothetical protein
MLKAASDALFAPFDTLTTMLESVATFAALGVPLNDPLELLNSAQLGLFDTV